MTEETEELRDKDRAILHHISKGRTDTHLITQATTLEAHEIRYSLNKLQELGLVELEKPDGMVEREVNGQKRVFQAPLQTELTNKGRRRVEKSEEDIEEFDDLSRDELINRLHDLENRVEELEQSFEVFRKQVQRRMG